MSLRKKFYQVFKAFFVLIGRDKAMEDALVVQCFAEEIATPHFNQEGLSLEQRTAFLKKQLTEIEVETHAYCNRKCSFCPNAIIDRSNKNDVMPSEVFSKIIDELSQFSYSGTLRLHRFNEPLAHESIYDRIAEARVKLPGARIGFHSNGDYVTAPVLDRLEKAGMDFVIISLYPVAQQFNAHTAREYVEKYLSQRGLVADWEKDGPCFVKCRVRTAKMEVTVSIYDLIASGNDRGGVLKHLTRAERCSPCSNPFSRLFIDWTGDVLPCCNLRGDVPSHKGYVWGNVKDVGAGDLYFSARANELRRHLVDFSLKKGVCRTCDHAIYPRTPDGERFLTQRIKEVSGTHI